MELKRELQRHDASGSADIEAARRVLQIEGKALSALCDALDQDFVDAVDMLHGISGRVIVSGMGKSGHIARKIAATMASTGTPAFYVHPGEASHGDLGMITKDDAVLCLSNSGNTAELSDLVAYARRFSIPLLSIIGRSDSILGEASDCFLVLPQAAEACPMGLAPTTSTTTMLALGDALAVALLERKGFSADNFHALHPGGRLGQALIKVSSIMHTGDAVPLVHERMPMREALLVMTAKSFGCVGVLDDADRLIGIITDGDLRRHLNDDLLNLEARQIMTASPKVVDSNALAAEALRRMNEANDGKGITSLFVMDGGRIAGILHIHDCLRSGVA